MMQSITKFIDQQQTPSSLSAAQLKDLLENSYGSRDVLSLSKDYTEDTPALLELLLKIHSHTENRTLKVRCTKLRKKLQRQMECEPQIFAGEIELWVASCELVVRGRGDNCASARFHGLLIRVCLSGVLSFEKKCMDLLRLHPKRCHHPPLRLRADNCCYDATPRNSSFGDCVMCSDKHFIVGVSAIGVPL
ncbi:hypothetical protein JTB14_037945 [Gonioctena quinquepunctata]|nr:hypothetical protein JTB14_037945 [Gonioctena quinquepunctata]